MKRQFLTIMLGLALLGAGGCNGSSSGPSSNDTGGVEPDVSSTPSAGTASASSPVEGDVANCPAANSPVSLKSSAEGLIFEQFNFRPTAVELAVDTLTFKNDRYGFVFCRGNRSWTVQAMTPESTSSPEDYDALLQEIANPTYQSIDLADQTYEARVRLEASWLTAQGENDVEPDEEAQEEVVFELIKPGESEPIAQVLYSLANLQERELGFSVGVPEITQAVAYNGNLWWSIGFERAEGASGIATLIQYDPDADQLTLWQPEALQDNHVTDLALTEEGDELTLWLGTQTTSEGNPYLPAQGLVRYRPMSNAVKSYTVHNSPLIGAIPTRVLAVDDALWVGTGNGACEVQWQSIDDAASWDCWQFTAQAALPDGGVGLYDSLLAEKPLTQVTGKTLEVLWSADTDIEAADGASRYEVVHEAGFETQLEIGAERYAEDSFYDWLEPAGLVWPGRDWAWNGDSFVRSQDQVAQNHFGGGPLGIGPEEYSGYINDWNVMRGKLDLLELTDTKTRIRYYSGWVEADQLEPYAVVVPVERPDARKPNPLEAVKESLEPIDPFPESE